MEVQSKTEGGVYMIDNERFSRELYEEFLEKHPKLKADDSLLAQFAKISADIATLAIEKYDRENPR